VKYTVNLQAYNFYTTFYNLDASSPWSPVATFYSSDLPQSTPQLSFTDRTSTGATINWSLLTNPLAKGYSTIDPYYLLWVDDCQGSSITNLLVNSTSETSYAISNIPPGSVCKFRMNVLNIIGYSKVYSSTLKVLFASLPDAPPKPVYAGRSGGNAVIGLDAYISISWEAPIHTGGLPILGYLVQLSKDGGTFFVAYDGSV